MIIRIVRLTLDPERTADFIALFEHASPTIRQFNGCRHLELWQDARFPNIYSTLSHWQRAEDLEAYRSSALFKETWGRARRFLVAPPEAWSYRKVSTVSHREQVA